MKTLLILILLFAAPQSCQDKSSSKETVLDNKISLEDSIHYKVDSLPPLCDGMVIQKNYVDIGGCKLYCEAEGKGTPIVLINGGPGGTHHYFHPWFSRAKSFSKVIYYDQRGCGKSDYAPGEGYSFRQAIDDLHKLKQKLGINEKWIVCGYSYGGAVAQYYTAEYPDEVAGMVLIGASTVLHDAELNNSRQQDYILPEERERIKEIYKLYKEGKLTDVTQLIYNIQLNGDWKRQNFLKPTKDEIVRAALYEWVHDKNFNQVMSNSLGQYDFKDVFDGCPVPTLICEGKWDLTWNENKPQILKKNHPAAKLVMFEHSGHSIYHDEPDLFFKTLKSFVTSLKPIDPQAISTWHNYAASLIEPQENLISDEKAFFAIVENEGANNALEYYESQKLKNGKVQLFTESGMNRLGYTYLQKKDYASAIILFDLNVDAYPDSWNVYDSLGEAYLDKGDKEKAKENYGKSLQLNPGNDSAKKVLSSL